MFANLFQDYGRLRLSFRDLMICSWFSILCRRWSTANLYSFAETVRSAISSCCVMSMSVNLVARCARFLDVSSRPRAVSFTATISVCQSGVCWLYKTCLFVIFLTSSVCLVSMLMKPVVCSEETEVSVLVSESVSLSEWRKLWFVCMWFGGLNQLCSMFQISPFIEVITMDELLPFF